MANSTNMESLQSIVSIIDKFSPKFYKSCRKWEQQSRMLAHQCVNGMSADFRRISESEQLKIDNVFQKAFLEVNEEGTVAAAVTTTQVMFGCARSLPPLEVVVNRPFFCAIVATNTGTQLFNARVIDPITV